ncbi:MAG TPA: hypothetical protein DHV62_09375 [Elusimicrobia bacterium]|jgi:DNA-binding transcriptional regulator YhcF (GntR family)|nr:hypothetical protein [Elusimicrobiota bacterium]
MDEIIETLEKVRATNQRYVLPDFIKPCVALMMEEGFEKGQGLRDKVAFTIATELRRIGKTSEVAEKILFRWDEKNSPRLGFGVIRNKIKSAYRREYTFGCNNELLQSYCQNIDKQFCRYYREFTQLNNLGRKTSNRDFYKYGWQQKLSLSEQAVYHSLIELEKKRGVWAGSLLFASHREIAEISGVSLNTIGKGLSGLTKYRLITYKPGEPYRWRVVASEIRRIIPIPEPNSKSINSETHKLVKSETGKG